MKKLVSRFMAVLMAMTMILSMSMTAFAAEDATRLTGTGKLTVNNTVEGKTLDLYQIFTATKNEAGNVAYTLNPEYEGFFKANVNGASALTGEALSEKAYEYVKTQVGEDGKNGVNFAKAMLATVYKGNIIKNLIMDCQSYTKYRPNETTGGIFVSWRRKEELPTGA